MCIEHKQYWQCCMLVDSSYIDPCPLPQIGQPCTIEERIHPIGGYCVGCRRSRNKLEDDAVTSPMYTRNDGYDRPWEPRKYKPLKSEPLKFPTYSYSQQEPDRGRKSRRTPPPDMDDLIYKPKYSYHYTERPQTPPSSDDDSRRKKKQHRRHEKEYHDRGSHNKERSGAKRSKEHRSRGYSRSPEPVQYRVASPRTLQRLQRQGLLPPLDQMYSVQMPQRSKR